MATTPKVTGHATQKSCNKRTVLPITKSDVGWPGSPRMAKRNGPPTNAARTIIDRGFLRTAGLDTQLQDARQRALHAMVGVWRA